MNADRFAENAADRIHKEIQWYCHNPDFRDVAGWGDSREDLATILTMLHRHDETGLPEVFDLLDDLVRLKNQLLLRAATGHAEKVCG